MAAHAPMVVYVEVWDEKNDQFIHEYWYNDDDMDQRRVHGIQRRSALEAGQSMYTCASNWGVVPC
jgi:hypothetical protein